MSERTAYPQGLITSASSTLNTPVVNPALASRQLSAAESTMLSSQSSIAAARNMEALANAQNAPNPTFMSQLGGAASGIAKTAAGVLTGAGSGVLGAVVNGVTNGAIGNITSGLSSLASGDVAKGMSSLSNAMAGIAGVSGDSASQKRAENLPPNGEVLSTDDILTKVDPGTDDDWRLKISAPWGLIGGTLGGRLENTNGLVFPYTPTVTISTTANYNTTQFTHNNYPFSAYKNSQVDDITITGPFSCETPDDAEYWLAATLFLRAATKMFFGASSNPGNPPIICKLNGYGKYVFNDISCIIKNFNVTLPPDVDYILYEGAEKTWVPILSDISVTLSPIYSREKIRKFNLQDYAKGNIGSTKGFA